MCAYVALFAVRRPEVTTTYGDLHATGYIVTPLPGAPAAARHRASGCRRTPHSNRCSRRPRRGYLDLVTTLLDDAGINYLSMVGRTKTVRRSLRRPTAPWRAAGLLRPAGQITDSRHSRDHLPPPRRDAVADLLADQLHVLDDRDMGQETASEGRWGYASRHLLVAVASARRPGLARSSTAAPRCRSARAAARLGRVRARHPLQGHRPGSTARPRPPLHPRGGAARAGRSRVHHDPRPAPEATTATEQRHARRDDPRISGQDLATFLASSTPTPAGPAPTTTPGSGLLLELGITSIDELAVLSPPRQRRDQRRMGYATRPARSAVSTTPSSQAYGTATSRCTATPTARELLRARLARMRGL